MKSTKRSNKTRISAALFSVLLLVTSLLFAFPASAVDLLGVMTAEVFAETEGEENTLRYRIYSPQTLSAQAAENGCGILVFLHDEDCRGDDNVDHISDSAKTALLSAVLNDDTLNQSMLIIAPQCPSDSGWTSDNGRQLDLVSDLVRALCANMKIDASRIGIVGVSDGASGAYALLARQNDADAVVFSAAFLAAGTCVDPDAVDAYAKTKIFAVTSDDDPVTPSRSVDQFIASMDGRDSVVYSRYTGAGHEVWVHAFTDETLVSPFLTALKPYEAPAEEVPDASEAPDKAEPVGTEAPGQAEHDETPVEAPSQNAPDGGVGTQSVSGAADGNDAPGKTASLPKIGNTEVTAPFVASVLLITACVLAAVFLFTGLFKNNFR